MKVKAMDELLIVLLTALITVALVLVVEALIVYILVRSGAVGQHLTRHQCPCCRSQHAVRYSNQVTTTSQAEQVDDSKSLGGAVLGQPKEPLQIDIVSKTVPTTGNSSGRDDAVTAAAVDAINAGGHDDRPDSKCSQTLIKRTVEDQQHYCSALQTGVACRQPCPSRPCSCWTQVSSEIRYENEENGVVVYKATMIVPSSCQLAPRRHWSDSHMEHVKPSTRTCSTRSCPSKVNNSGPGLPLSLYSEIKPLSDHITS